MLKRMDARYLPGVRSDCWRKVKTASWRTEHGPSTTFGALLTAAVKDDLLAASPMAKATLPKVEYPPLVPLTVEQVHRLAECAPGFLRAAVVMGAGTGLRQGEAMAVTADRVDFLRRELRVDRQAHIATHGLGRDGLLFHLKGEPVGRQALSSRLKDIAIQAEVDATWHDLRHHHASVLLSAGVSPRLSPNGWVTTSRRCCRRTPT